MRLYKIRACNISRIDICHIMIKGFKSKTARDIYDGLGSRSARPISIELHQNIQRLFDQLDLVHCCINT